jgi:hypothetical protein
MTTKGIIIPLSNDIKKLEVIGKSGKITKFVNLNLNNLDILKFILY